MKILALTKVTKHNIHLPKVIAEKLELENGDSIIWVLEDAKITVKKA